MTEETKKIIIDTDIALGQRERDVDDGLAIVMASNSPELSIEAITLTYGNDSLENVEKSMTALAKLVDGLPATWSKGARDSGDLGLASEATDRIIATLEKEPATIIAIGPVTNIASAIILRPEIATKIEEIVMVAGRRPGQRFLTGNYNKSHPDLNFERDPEAMKVLLNSRVPLTLAPFEVSSQVWFTDTVLSEISKKNSPLSKYLVDHCKNWLAFWQKIFSTPFYPIEGFNPFDTLAIAWLTDRELLSWQQADLRIEIDDYDLSDETMQGTGEARKPYLHARLDSNNPQKETAKTVPESDSGKRCNYIYDVQREEFLKRLVQKLG